MSLRPTYLTTHKEIDTNHKKINELNEDLDILLEKQNKATHLLHISLKQLFIKISNTTIDVLKELVIILFKKRKFKYQHKFKWWLKYNHIGKDIYTMLQKEDRLIYFGLFLLLLSLLLNFLTMIH